LDRFQIGVHFVALAAAFALAVPIGWDREKRARSAGLRTFPLVAMASCGFIQASESLLVHSPDGLAKVVEGLITGIGFIGGGAILQQGTTVQGTAQPQACGPPARSASQSGSAATMSRLRWQCLRS